jgi:hypothetical protein
MKFGTMLISAVATLQSAAFAFAGDIVTPPVAPSASGGDSGNDAAIVLLVLVGAVLLAVNGRKHGAPVAAPADEDEKTQ